MEKKSRNKLQKHNTFSLKRLEEIMIKRFQESKGSNSNKILEFNIQQNPHLFTQALKEIIKNGYKPK